MTESLFGSLARLLLVCESLLLFGCACGPGQFSQRAASVFYVFCVEHMRDDICRS
jgi:hypothetical protein